jgi:hypothetical protein
MAYDSFLFFFLLPSPLATPLAGFTAFFDPVDGIFGGIFDF